MENYGAFRVKYRKIILDFKVNHSVFKVKHQINISVLKQNIQRLVHFKVKD